MASSKKPARKKAFREGPLLNKIAKLVDDYQAEKIPRELAKRIPDAEQRAAWLWGAFGRDLLPDDSEIRHLLADSFTAVPIATAVEALQKADADSERRWLPDFGTRAYLLLYDVATVAEDQLIDNLEAMPRPMQLGAWLTIAMGSKEAEVPEDVVAEIAALLPTHVASGEMDGLELGKVLSALRLNGEDLHQPLFDAIGGAGKLHLLTVGCILLRVPSEQLLPLVPKIEVSDFQGSWYGWWTKRRLELLADESLDQHLAVFEAMVPRMMTGPTWLGPKANVAAAHVLAMAFLEAGAEVPDALLQHFPEGFSHVREWMPIFGSLSHDELERARDRILAAQRDQQKYVAMPLDRFRGQEAIARSIDETIDAITNGRSVVNAETTWLGLIGGPVVEPLCGRIESLEEQLGDESEHKQRAVIAGLRQSLGVALGEVAAAGHPIEERFDRFLEPDERIYDAGDHIRRFLTSDWYLFRRWLLALPEDRLMTWVEAWLRHDPSGRFEIPDKIERLLGDERKHLLAHQTKADRVRALAAATGRPLTRVVYGLTRVSDEDERSLNRVLAEPKGYEHELTLALLIDLHQAPELGKRFAPDARALAVFVDEPDEGFERAEVVALSEQDCEAGFEGGHTFVIDELKIPEDTFDGRGDAELSTLRSAIYTLDGVALAPPRFIQDPTATGNDFLLQAGEWLTGLNLGDNGNLYVYDDLVTWDSH